MRSKWADGRSSSSWFSSLLMKPRTCERRRYEPDVGTSECVCIEYSFGSPRFSVHLLFHSALTHPRSLLVPSIIDQRPSTIDPICDSCPHFEYATTITNMLSVLSNLYHLSRGCLRIQERMYSILLIFLVLASIIRTEAHQNGIVGAMRECSGNWT